MPIDPQMLSMIRGGAEPVQAPPVPMPQAPPPKRNPLELMAPLFALGAALSGNPQGGQRFLSSAQQAQDRIRQQTQEDEAFVLRRQQIEMQAARDAEVMRQREAERQQRAQALLLKTMQDVAQAVPTFKKKADYDQYIDFAEQTLAVSGVRIPPNSLRAKFPYRAPNASQLMYDALDKLIKNPANKAAVESGAILQGALSIDTDGDGIPDKPIPVSQAIKESGYPIVLDDKGQPFTVTSAKAENIQTIDEVFKGLIAKFTTEKGRPPSTSERGEIALEAEEQVSKRRKEGNASVIVNTGQAGTLPQKVQVRVDMKARGFENNPTVKRIATQAEAYDFVRTLSNTSTNPADDQALIYAFAKSMDPDSVVREGEYATVQKYAQSWLDNFGFNAARVISNREFLTPQARQNMKETIRKRYEATRHQYDNLRKQYGQQINRLTGLQDGEDRLIDYAAAFPEVQGRQPAPPTQQGQQQGNQPSIGSIVTLKDGRRVKVEGFNPDGTIKGTVVR